MSEPTLSLEDRVRSLELALTESEQWNVCVCGHHGSAHNSWNKCLVCECRHFGTRREANTPNVDELLCAVKATDYRPSIRLMKAGVWLAQAWRGNEDYTYDYREAEGKTPGEALLKLTQCIDAYLKKAVTP